MKTKRQENLKRKKNTPVDYGIQRTNVCTTNASIMQVNRVDIGIRLFQKEKKYKR